MPNTPKVLIAIPMYNCEKQIPRVLEEFTSELCESITKIHLIDNQSHDATTNTALSKIKELGLSKASVFKNIDNYNLGGSQKIAFNQAIAENFDYVAILHGDNQAKTEELLELINFAKNNPTTDIVFGARFLPSSTLKGYSLIRIWGNYFVNSIYSLFTLRPIWDLGSGINLFKVSALKKIPYQNCTDSLTFNMDLLLEILRGKLTYKYLPITWREEDQVSNAKIFNVGFASLKTLFKWRLGIQLKENTKSYQTQKLTE